MITKNKKHDIADYIIYISGSHYKAIDGNTGNHISNSTNLSTVINAALAGIGTSWGGLIYFKPGDYTLDATIDLSTYEGISFCGPGLSHNDGPCRIRLANSVNDDMFYSSPAALTSQSLTFQDFMINGNKTNNTGGSAINLTSNSQSNYINNIFVNNCENSGIIIGRGEETLISNSYSKANNANGLLVTGGYGLMVNCCRFDDNADDGILIDSTSNVTINNCGADGNTEAGASIYAQCNLMNSRFSSNTGTTSDAQIKVNNDWCVVIGNYLSCGGTDGIYISASVDECFICNNMIYNSTDDFSNIREVGVIYNTIGKETANAEEPQSTTWQIGAIVDFTDSGDASGDGIYIKDTGGSWVKIN